MRIDLREGGHSCRNCDREYQVSQLDRRFWCTRCRREVIRRARRIARIFAALAAAVLAAYVVSVVGTSSRFMMIYFVMIAAAYFFVFKLAQRVAFEVIRGRGVPPPMDQDEE